LCSSVGLSALSLIALNDTTSYATDFSSERYVFVAIRILKSLIKCKWTVSRAGWQTKK
jgi:hypothetical protein